MPLKMTRTQCGSWKAIGRLALGCRAFTCGYDVARGGVRGLEEEEEEEEVGEVGEVKTGSAVTVSMLSEAIAFMPEAE